MCRMPRRSAGKRSPGARRSWCRRRIRKLCARSVSRCSPVPDHHHITCHVHAYVRHQPICNEGCAHRYDQSIARVYNVCNHNAQAKLEAASQLRKARLAELAAKAAATSIKVEEAKHREDAAAAERREALFARLRRAELWRKECLAARKYSQAAVCTTSDQITTLAQDIANGGRGLHEYGRMRYNAHDQGIQRITVSRILQFL